MKPRLLAVPLALAAVLLLGPATPGPSGPRVMPLGDSITYGNPRTGVSYRTSLYNHLHPNFVGSVRFGNLPDQDNEGHPGMRIDELRSGIDDWLALNRPQYVLLHIGTNDVVQNYDLPNAPARLQDLVTHIIRKVPGVTILVASIVPSPDAGLNDRITTYNAAIPAAVAAAGPKAHFVDLNARMSLTDISADNLHPTDAGLLKMGDIWSEALSPLITR